MAHSSNSIVKDVNKLKKIIQLKHILLSNGFMRKYALNEHNMDIPPSIIDYIMLYAFLFFEFWCKSGDAIHIVSDIVATHIKKSQLDNNQRRQYYYNSVYGNQYVSSGKHEWKIKTKNISSEWGRYALIGISWNTDHCDNHFHYQNPGAGYGLLTKGSLCDIRNKWISSDACKWRIYLNDIVTIHLDLDDYKLGYSRNGKYLGDAFVDIERKSYRLSVSMLEKDSSVEIISYSSG